MVQVVVMSAARVEQLYYTHCTHRTAFGRRFARHLADHVYGYATRAASVSAEAIESLEKDFRGLLKYRLPRDTPPELWSQLTALDDRAPARLVYFPDCGGKAVVGQICYRTYDTSPDRRVGSYFAHLLFATNGDGRADALSALGLCNAAGWCREDAGDLAPGLSALQSFDELLPPGTRAAVDDRVLRSFVSAANADDFDDPGSVVPRFLRRAAPADRQKLLATLVRGFLELDAAHESLLLVAPAGLAALLFYGMLRLVPASFRSPRLSFSTFAAECDPLPATLVSTNYYNPHGADLTEAERRAARFALNIYQQMRHTPFQQSHALFPELIVGLLAQQGCGAVDALLHSAGALKITSVGDLERLAQGHRGAERLLAAGGRVVLSDNLQHEHVRRFVRRRLEEEEVPPEMLAALAASANNGLLLQLLARPGGGLPDVALELAGLLSDDSVASFVRNLSLPVELRSNVLLTWASYTRRLPTPLLAEFYAVPEDAPSEPAWAPGLWQKFIHAAGYDDLLKLLRGERAHAAGLKSGGLNTLHRLLISADLHRREIGAIDTNYAACKVVCRQIDDCPFGTLGLAVRRFGELLTRNYQGQQLAKWYQSELLRLCDAQAARTFAERLETLLRMFGDSRGRPAFTAYRTAELDGWERVKTALQELPGCQPEKQKKKLIERLVHGFSSTVPETLGVADRHRLLLAIVKAALAASDSAFQDGDYQLLWQRMALTGARRLFARSKADCQGEPYGLETPAAELPVLCVERPKAIDGSLQIALHVEATSGNRSQTKQFPLDRPQPIEISLRDLTRRQRKNEPPDRLQLTYQLSATSWPDLALTTTAIDVRIEPGQRRYTVRLIDGDGQDQDDEAFLAGALTCRRHEANNPAIASGAEVRSHDQ